MANTKALQSGFSLIEIMVAVVILSVGLLGLAGMQFGGLRSVSDSTTYTKAAMAVADMAERIRSNPIAADNNVFASVSSNAGAGATTTISCAAASNPYCGAYYDIPNVSTTAAAICTPSQLATFDMTTWFCGEITNAAGTTRTNALTDTLDSAQAAITCMDNDGGDGDPCSNGSPHEISLTWNERAQEEGGAAVQRTIAMTVQP